MTPDEQPALGPLATSALRSLREAFAERNHNPGATHMTALASIEPPRDSRRLFDLSYAAMGMFSCIA
jgi:hypothetical protein